MYQNNLIFPSLVYIGEARETSVNSDGECRSLRQLSWEAKNKIRPCPELPDKWEKYLDEQIFAISTDYYNEIQRTVNMGIMERCLYRSFDTTVRDMCLGPSDAYFETAFRLIADCVVDPKTFKQTLPDQRRNLLPNMMLYRFWQFQTGCGLPWFKAKMDELVQYDISKDLKSVRVEFFGDMAAHNTDIIDGFTQRSAKVSVDG